MPVLLPSVLCPLPSSLFPSLPEPESGTPDPRQFVRDRQPCHGVGGVAHGGAVRRRDAVAGERRRERRAAHQQRRRDAGGAQVVGRGRHLVRRAHEQAGKADEGGRALPPRRDQLVRRALDAQVGHGIAVRGEDDPDEVLADVVHVPAHRRKQDRTARGALVALQVRLEVVHRGLHHFGGDQHLGDDQLPGAEQAADLVHPGHERTVDDRQRPHAAEQLVEGLVEACSRSLDDHARDALLGGQVLIDGADARLRLAVARHEGVHGALVSVEQHGFRELDLRGVERREAHELLGVDDCGVETGPKAVVQEDRVEHLAPRGRDAERDVRDAKDREGARNPVLDELDAPHRLAGGPAELGVAGRRREDERVQEHLAAAEAPRLEAFDQAPRDLGLALGRARHPVRGVLVDASGHDRGAEPARERGDTLEARPAVLEVDRVEHRFSGDELERGGHHLGVGGVHHQGDPDGAAQGGHDGPHGAGLVPLGVREADVEDAGAPAHLPPPDLGRFCPAPLPHQFLEPPRAEHVGALPDQQRGRFLNEVDHLAARESRRVEGGRHAGSGAVRHLAQAPDVLLSGAAAPADDVHPARGGEASHRPRHVAGALVVAPLAVGDAGVGDHRNPTWRQGRQRAHVLGHRTGAGRAVDPDPERSPGLDHHRDRLDRLTAEGGAGGLDRRRDRHGQVRRGLGAGDQRGLEVERVLTRLDEQNVGAALREALGLNRVRCDELGERDAAGERQRLGCRPHRARDEAGARRVDPFGLGACLPRQLGRPPVDLPATIREPVLGQHHRRRAEGVGFDDVGAGREVAAVEVEHDIRPVQHERLVAADEPLAAVIDGAEAAAGESRAGGAVEHQDPPAEQLGEQDAPRLRRGHGASVNRARAAGEGRGAQGQGAGGVCPCRCSQSPRLPIPSALC